MAKRKPRIVFDKETNQWRDSTWEEDLEFERKVNLEFFGKATAAGIAYQDDMRYWKRLLDKEESWLRTNPNNEITRGNVIRYRKLYEEAKEMCDLFD